MLAIGIDQHGALLDQIGTDQGRHGHGFVGHARMLLARLHPHRRDLAPAARGSAEIDDAGAGLQDMVAVVDLDQLVGRTRTIAVGLRPLHVGIVDMALQPAAR